MLPVGWNRLEWLSGEKEIPASSSTQGGRKEGAIGQGEPNRRFNNSKTTKKVGFFSGGDGGYFFSCVSKQKTKEQRK